MAGDGLINIEERPRLGGDLRQFVHRYGAVNLKDPEAFGWQLQQTLWQTMGTEDDLPEAPPTQAADAESEGRCW